MIGHFNPFATALFTPSVGIYCYVSQLIVMYFHLEICCVIIISPLGRKVTQKYLWPLATSNFGSLWLRIWVPFDLWNFCGSWPQ